MPCTDSGDMLEREGTPMKVRMLMAAGMMALLGGCATYDYAGGESGGYYRGTPGVQYRYPPGYYDGYYGYPYYYYGPGWLGLYDYPVYPGPYYYQRPIHRPPPPPPPRPGHDYPGGPPPPGSVGPRPPRPAEPGPSSSPSPWRNLNRLKQGGHPPRKTQEP